MKAVIVDDEPLARKSIRLLLERDGEVEVAGECSGVDAAELIDRTHPDMLFLDIQMPEVGGFELLEQIGANAVPVVIFVTAYADYALRAFEAHGLDYLLKPFDDTRFRKALDRAKEQVRTLGRSPYAQRFLVRHREKLVVVNAAEIDWIEAADYYVTLHAGGKGHLLRETMVVLEKRLDPARFVRVHRSAIVNIDRVREIHPLFRGDCSLILADGTQVKLSRARREEFERLFTR
ncbi:MAG TPA: LytTR family DNA-binding domain-containing protein [Thermoanaerobaculia bacterium]|nr:LytTR family DNA-binding domain-containing protein [Thermoanaerobaculia bacterium]